MALQKDLTFSGHLNNFIKIKDINLDYFQQRITVLFWVFKDRSTFLANKYDYAREIKMTFKKEDLNLPIIVAYVREIERAAKVAQLDGNMVDGNMLTDAIDAED